MLTGSRYPEPLLCGVARTYRLRQRRRSKGGRPTGFDKTIYKRRNEVERTIKDPAQGDMEAVADGSLGLAVQAVPGDQFTVAGAPFGVFVEQLREREVDSDTHLTVGVLFGPGARIFLAEKDHLEPVAAAIPSCP
jgi:hypothetical protein